MSMGYEWDAVDRRLVPRPVPPWWRRLWDWLTGQ
jgi:hypothetical protein